MSVHASLLMQIQRRRRLAQLIDLLLGRATFPPPVKGDRPPAEQLAEMKRKVFEEIEGEGRSR